MNCVPAWRSWWKIQIYGKIHPCSPLHVVILYPPGNGSDLSGKKVLSTCTRSIFPAFFASEICMIYECSRATLIVVAQVHFGSAKSDWSRSGALLAGIESKLHQCRKCIQIEREGKDLGKQSNSIAVHFAREFETDCASFSWDVADSAILQYKNTKS